MSQINRRLIPIKAHYLFFMAAMGPILPQIYVFGKELGVPPDVMGFITSFLPILYILAKPAVGYLIDSFPSIRKTIFISIVSTMILCYAGFYFLPIIPVQNIPKLSTYNFSEINVCDNLLTTKNIDLCLINHKMVNCSIDCGGNVTQIGFISMEKAQNTTISPVLRLCMDSTLGSSVFKINDTCKSVQCVPIVDENQTLGSCFYGTWTFWLFVIFLCIGTIGFNISNCVSDATCFDMLGEKTMHYGAQRVWGTIGFGLTALIAGLTIHHFQLDSASAVDAITPALIIMVVLGAFDIVSIKWLKLPRFTSEGETIATKVTELLMQKKVLIFLCFATVAGIFDSFIFYFMFWHLEEIAAQTDYMDRIKLIEGCVVAAECLGGEILFFLISGKILKRIGYVHCLSFCFFMYFIRLGLISLIPNPWWLVLVELFMQGPTYALCYTCIVGYASEVAPPGTTATVQGLVAGMDDGAGFAIGSLIGGQMYKRLGGVKGFQIFAIAAIITCFAHILLRPAKNCTEHLKHTERSRDVEGDATKKSKYPESPDMSNVELLPKLSESGNK